ncbi:MAG: hypothetical protein WBZ36_02245 [Candidatus Nitrosopolaris sp.]
MKFFNFSKPLLKRKKEISGYEGADASLVSRTARNWENKIPQSNRKSHLQVRSTGRFHVSGI